MTAVFEKSLLNLPLNLHVEMFDVNRHMEDALWIEEECFSDHMQDSREELFSFFSDPHAVGILLYENWDVIGFMKGTLISKQNSPGILERFDDLYAHQTRTFYADSISILEEYRTPAVLDFFIHEIACYTKNAGHIYFTGHARKKRGYSRMLQSRYGAKKIMALKDWQNFGEPFDYIVFETAHFPTLHPVLNYLMKSVRFVYRHLRRWKRFVLRES